MSDQKERITAIEFITRALQAGYEVYCTSPLAGLKNGRTLNLFKPLGKAGDFSLAQKQVALLYQGIPLQSHRGISLRKGLGTRLKQPPAIQAWRNDVEEIFLNDVIDNLARLTKQKESKQELAYRFERKVEEEVLEDPEVRAIQAEIDVTERDWEELRENLNLVEEREEQLKERLKRAKTRATAARQEHLEEFLYVTGGREL